MPVEVRAEHNVLLDVGDGKVVTYDMVVSYRNSQAMYWLTVRGNDHLRVRAGVEGRSAGFVTSSEMSIRFAVAPVGKHESLTGRCVNGGRTEQRTAAA